MRMQQYRRELPKVESTATQYVFENESHTEKQTTQMIFRATRQAHCKLQQGKANFEHILAANNLRYAPKFPQVQKKVQYLLK